MTEDVSVTASFEAKGPYTLEYLEGDGGSISGDEPADGRLRSRWHSGDGRPRLVFSLRGLERRHHGQPADRQERDGTMSA